MHVYTISNTVNGKVYVGQHSGENLEAYWRHNVKAALGNRGNKLYLYRAIRKYGPDVFSIQSLYTPVDKEDMDDAEIFFISLYATQDQEFGYNLTAGGGGRLGTGGTTLTDEHKAAISAANKGRKHSPEHVERIAAANRGKKFSPERCEALSAGQKGCKKPPRTPEHREKLRQNKLLWWAERKASNVEATQEPPKRVFTEEHKRNMSLSRLGKKLPEEQKQKISDALKLIHMELKVGVDEHI